MNPIDPAKLKAAQRLQTGAVAPVHGTQPARSLAAPTTGAAETDRPAVAPRLRAGPEAPVDTDRVTEIRRAIEEGRYPIVPAKIADAMIAAGFLLRTPE